ncbi:MAG: hypothetical protein QOI44_2687, partial [Actinomycetota bacterium]|nr:hypothetical protein [Actinomycetota bacterium]
MNRLRRIARGPRAWVAAVRGHRSTRTAQHLTRRVLARGALSVRSLAGRRARRAEWTKVAADVGALPSPPPLARSVAIVVMARGDAAATARVAAASTSDLLCFVLP